MTYTPHLDVTQTGWCGRCGQVYPCAHAVACAYPITGLGGPYPRREHYDNMRRARLGALLRHRELGLPLTLPAAIYLPPHPAWPPRMWQRHLPKVGAR